MRNSGGTDYQQKRHRHRAAGAALLAAGCLVLSACGGADKAETAATETGSAATGAPAEAEEMRPAELVPVVLGYDSNEYAANDLWFGSLEVARVSSGSAETYAKLDEALAAFNQSSAEALLTRRKEKAAAAEQNGADSQGQSAGGTFFELFNARSDTSVVSLVQQVTDRDYTKEGPDNQIYTSRTGVNFDPATGEMLKLSDLVSDLDRFRSVLADRAAAAGGLDSGDSDVVSEVDRLVGDGSQISSEALSFSAEPEGLTVYLNTGASFQFFEKPDTSIAVTIPVEGNENLFTPRMKNAAENYVLSVSGGAGDPEALHGHFGDGGAWCGLSFEKSEDEAGYLTSPGLVTAGGTRNLPEIGDGSWYMGEVRLARQNGVYTLLLTLHGDNDWRETFAYVLADGTAEYTGEAPGDPEAMYSGSPDANGDGGDMTDEYHYSLPVADGYCFTDPADLRLYSTSQLVGTASAIRSGSLGPDGAMKLGERLTYAPDNAKIIPKRDLAAAKVDDDGKETGETVNLPAGEPLDRLYTDDESYLIVKTADGTLAKLAVSDAGGWPIRIEGTDVSELFDGIYFAG